MKDINHIVLSTEEPEKTFKIPIHGSIFAVTRIKCEFNFKNNQWHEVLRVNNLKIRVELSCTYTNSECGYEIFVKDIFKEAHYLNVPEQSFKTPTIELPKENCRLTIGPNPQKYDRMKITLLQNSDVSFIVNLYSD